MHHHHHLQDACHDGSSRAVSVVLRAQRLRWDLDSSSILVSADSDYGGAGDGCYAEAPECRRTVGGHYSKLSGAGKNW